jgi:hypothetical protein
MNTDYILLLPVYFNISEDIRSREVRGTRGNKKTRKARENPTELGLFKTQTGYQKHYWTLQSIIIENQSFYFTILAP